MRGDDYLDDIDNDPDRQPESRQRKAKVREQRRANGHDAADASAPNHDADPGDTAPAFSDAKLAREFGDRYVGRLLYVDERGHWYRWKGDHWQQDATRFAWDEARKICVEKAATSTSNWPNQATKLASKQTIAAVESIARADRRLVATMADFNSNHTLLNCLGTSINLRDGTEKKPNDPADLCSKITSVAPAPPGTDCPQWKTFLAKIFPNNQDMVDYMQRALGSALTGLVRDQVCWFFYGEGSNGKGVILRMMCNLLGGYAVVAETVMLVESKHARHSTEIAMLAGARFVMASETGEGQAWDEAKLKALTGGDPRTARFMRLDNFTYKPTDKLFIAGNVKPTLKQVDEAIRRRLHLVPFNVKITEKEREDDPHFEARLLAEEGPAILRWLIDGCRIWLKDGLQPPKAVTAATNEYLSSEDAVGVWIEECCTWNKDATETGAELFASFKQWADKAGEPHKSQKKLLEALRKRGGIEDWRGTGGVRGLRGLRINRDYTDNQRHGEREP